MPILKAIESRRAFRALSTHPVPREVLSRLAEAAHLAPSSGNNQPWRIVTVIEDEQLNALKASLSAGNYWARKAPAIAALVTNAEWSMRLAGRDYAYFELGMAAMAYQLQAVEEGLYAHPIIGFDVAMAKQVLGIPDTCVLEVLIVVGYSGDTSNLSEKHQELERSARSRKPLDAIAAFDFWKESLVPLPKA